jgi:hypothetical protein
MSVKPQINVSEIAEAISGRGRMGHSPLYWWMWDHFEALKLERQGRADWISVTEEFSKLGFTNRDKTPLKRENVRKTWERVVRDKEKIIPPKPASDPRPLQRAVQHPVNKAPFPVVSSEPAPQPTDDEFFKTPKLREPNT